MNRLKESNEENEDDKVTNERKLMGYLVRELP